MIINKFAAKPTQTQHSKLSGIVYRNHMQEQLRLSSDCNNAPYSHSWIFQQYFCTTF